MIESSTFPLPMWLWRWLPGYYWYEAPCRPGTRRFTRACQELIDYKRKQRLLKKQVDSVGVDGVEEEDSEVGMIDHTHLTTIF